VSKLVHLKEHKGITNQENRYMGAYDYRINTNSTTSEESRHGIKKKKRKKIKSFGHL